MIPTSSLPGCVTALRKATPGFSWLPESLGSKMNLLQNKFELVKKTCVFDFLKECTHATMPLRSQWLKRRMTRWPQNSRYKICGWFVLFDAIQLIMSGEGGKRSKPVGIRATDQIAHGRRESPAAGEWLGNLWLSTSTLLGKGDWEPGDSLYLWKSEARSYQKRCNQLGAHEWWCTYCCWRCFTSVVGFLNGLVIDLMWRWANFNIVNAGFLL